MGEFDSLTKLPIYAREKASDRWILLIQNSSYNGMKLILCIPAISTVFLFISTGPFIFQYPETQFQPQSECNMPFHYVYYKFDTKHWLQTLIHLIVIIYLLLLLINGTTPYVLLLTVHIRSEELSNLSEMPNFQAAVCWRSWQMVSWIGQSKGNYSKVKIRILNFFINRLL